MKACILALTLVWICHGSSSGRLEGTVRDSSWAVVPSARLSGIQDETGFRFTIETDSRGDYAVAVPQGHYSIVVRRLGFRTISRMAVAVLTGATVRLDFQLEPGSVTEAITVTGAGIPRALAETPGAVLDTASLGMIPQNDRTVSGLAALAPGMLITPANGGEPGQLSSLGARPNTNRYSVDGISANNAVAGGGWPSFLPGARLPSMTALGTTHDLALYDSVAEVAVVTQGYTPASGRAPGGNIRIRTRSGSNQFHGSLFAAGRPTPLGAADWFTNNSSLPRQQSHLADEGGSVGGPLQRNRTFFFIAAEKLDLRQVYSWTTTVPSLAARELAQGLMQTFINQFPLPNGPALSFGIGVLRGSSAEPSSLTAVNARVDHVVRSDTRAFARVAATPSTSRSGYTQVEESSYANSTGVVGLTRDSSAWTLDTRASFARTSAESRWLPVAGAGGAFYSQFPSFAADFTTISVGGAGSVETGVGGRNRQDQIELSQTAGQRFRSHDLKGGLDYLQLRPVRGGPLSDWDIAFSSPTDQVLGPPAPIWVTYSAAQTSASRLHQLSGFVQDTWRVDPRLSVTYGFRLLSALPPRAAPGSNLFEVTETPQASRFSAIAAGTPLWGGDRLVADPAISAAWRLPGTEKTVVRASWATFHDGDFAVATDQLNGAPYLSLRSPQGAQVFTTPGLVPVELGYGFASNLRLPVYRRWDMTIQHQRGRDSLAFSYSGMTGSGLLRRETAFYQSGNLGQLSFATNSGASRYNGLNVSYRRDLTAGITANFSYSWSHSIDLGSSDSLLFLIRPSQPNISDRGPSDFDVRHLVSGALSYETAAKGPLRRLTGHWALSVLQYARSGFPVDVLLSETLDGSAISNYRPSLVAGVPLWLADSNAPAGRILNASAFSPPKPGLDLLGRNSIRGFGMWQTDVAAEKPLRLADGLQLRLRAEAFNVFNHPEFADPTRYLSSPLFGISGSPLNLMLGSGSPASGQAPAFQMGGPRMLQVSGRFVF